MPTLVKEFIFLMVLTAAGSGFSLLSGLSPAPWSTPALEAGEITPHDAAAIEVIWIDARPAAEYAEDHIENAISLNEDQWDDGFFELMDLWLNETKPIVVYCGSKSCGTSKRVAERLRENLPDAEIYSLKGGWEAWTE